MGELKIGTISREQMKYYYIKENYTVKDMCEMLQCKESDFYKKNREFGIRKKHLMAKIIRDEIDSRTDFILSEDERLEISRLIQGIDRQVSWHVDEIIKRIKKMEYKYADRRESYKVPNEGGVYLFFSKDKELLYIGKSANFSNRYRQHLKVIESSHIWSNNTYYYSDEFEYFKFVPVEEKWLQDIVEAAIIKNMNSKYNIMKVY